MSATTTHCPCGTGDTYPNCCGRWHGGEPAPTAEALMRSRYTAFVRGDEGYLLTSWAPSTRPDSLDLDPDVDWKRLVVLDRTAGGPFDDTGTVEFEAHYRQDGRRGVQHENSAFVRDQGRWLYLAPTAD